MSSMLPSARHHDLYLIQDVPLLPFLGETVLQVLVGSTLWRYPMVDLALSSALADVLSVETVVFWSWRATNVVILTSEAILTRVFRWVSFVSPMAEEVEPASRRVRVQCRASNDVGPHLPSVGLCVENWIPQWTTIRHVMEKSPWQDVTMDTCCGIHGVCACG
jgi:hypothetical protein